MTSYLVTQVGSWLNFIATLSLLTKILRGDGGSSGEVDNLPVALLLFLRMFPALIVSPLVGGPIADFFDKRRTMVILDVLSTVVAGLLFPLAARMQSKFVLYFSVLLLATVDAIYNPVKNSILPFMLKSDEEVNKATQLMAISWSVMGAVGAAVGGLLTGVGGVRFCFYMDGLTFAASAWLMYKVGSKWKLKDSAAESRKGAKAGAEEEVVVQSQTEKMLGGVRYLKGNGKQWAPLVFFKAYGCILWGSADLCNVVFADGNDFSLGFIFAAVGVGCLMGPVMADKILSRNQGEKSGEVEPRKMVWSCYVAVCIVAFAAAVGNEGLSSFIAAFALDEVKLTVLEVCTDVGFLGIAISVPLGVYVYRNWRSKLKGYKKLR
ncbi:hypothetical protein TrRE_jg11980 [Triparma retinervis]|uniref:MFS transporter n=1 Tax=Triparma retinervis TaxID=2557542 RepID=A0A9W7F8F2_9STRA|nr:hypothetical protein TrRE_jg11980 [Triparma retinervis]